VTQRGVFVRRRDDAALLPDVLRDREAGVCALRDRGVDAPVLRARVDDAPRPDPVRAEVGPLPVVTRFCVRAAAMGMRPVV
jgi:hypothetical protein